MLCAEWEKGKMDVKEVLNAVGEMLDSETEDTKRKHLFELANKVIDKEIPYDDFDDNLDDLYDLDDFED